jgi:NADH-quinone oxidoreductase subunit A
LWPFLLFGGLVIGLVLFMLVASALLGGRRRDRVTEEPYESGMPLTGTAHVRLSAKYYLIAMFFVLFDVETIFLITWASAVKETGWIGYGMALLFVAALVVALLYLWREGALVWGPRPTRNPQEDD